MMTYKALLSWPKYNYVASTLDMLIKANPNNFPLSIPIGQFVCLISYIYSSSMLV
jgi:hypothetical protein